MKNIAVIIIIAAGISSCNPKESENDKVINDSVTTVAKTDSSRISSDSHYFWTTDLDQKDGLIVKRVSPVSADSLTYINMINWVNEEFPEAKLSFIKQSNDSIYVKIGNSKFVTQQMGTTGAEAYLAEVTYNLTELKNINFVNINFKQGDHASPGTYTRTDFVFNKK